LASNVEGGALKFLYSQKSRWIVSALLVLALFLVRPGAQGLRSRIVRSISMAIGRQVEVGRVSLRLLPRPGFELQNFVVHDAQQFGAEPMLRSEEVSATLRVTSLLRGRLEIARLDFSEPSLNLVRNGEGRWNLEDLLEKAARTPVAPTGKARTEVRPGFPYIEADNGRINIKLGQEKKPYALLDADFALWQDTENMWSGRLRAQPVRTDFNLTDTGLLRIEGSWQRAASLRQTPLHLVAEWDRAQLGQLTKLIYGSDKGWRGTVRVAATANGTPAQLMLEADASVQDFRRYDISASAPLRLANHCKGQYSSVDRSVSDLSCRAPVGSGTVTVKGSFSATRIPRTYKLALQATAVPIERLVQLGLHTSKRIPDDLIATGKLDGVVTLDRAASDSFPNILGEGQVAGLHLSSMMTDKEVVAETIPLVLSVPAPELKARKIRAHEKTEIASPAWPNLQVGPVDVSLGRPLPAILQGRISRSGYSFELRGDAELQRFLRSAHMFGLFAPQTNAKGMAKLDLRLAAEWQDLEPPRVTGTMNIRSVQAEMPGLNTPLEIASANVTLAENETRIQRISASLADTAVSGSVILTRPCRALANCPVRFDLHADEIASQGLGSLLNASAGQPWYSFLSRARLQPLSYLTALRAFGKFSVGRFSFRNLEAERLTANVEIGNGKLKLWSLNGDFLKGRHSGDWSIDFNAKPAVYSGRGTFEDVSLEEIASATGSAWITGTAFASYDVAAQGSKMEQLFSSATGTLRVEAHDSLLPHLSLVNAGSALRVNRFSGEFLLGNGSFEIQQGKLETPAGIYLLSGTASLKRSLDLKLMRDTVHGFNITGTLPQLRIQAVTLSETQAALKP
jgi:hypothetical protein